MAKSPKTLTSHSPPRARTLSGPATRRRWTRELLQTRNRAFGPNGAPTTSRQTSATRTDTTSRLPISLGSTNKRFGWDFVREPGRWERDFWMQRQSAEIYRQSARTPTETKTRDLNGGKSPQARPIGCHGGDL